jgi:hypothetical protein
MRWRREVEREERRIFEATAEMRNLLRAAEESVLAGNRVPASIGGNPGFVDVALRLDAAVRARQHVYDIDALEEEEDEP